MIRGACHCGAVRFEMVEHRDWLTDCNCSVCRRYGALWLHTQRSEVVLVCAEDATFTYEWGDHLLAFHSCRRCGCTTHWSSISEEEPDRMAVNCRLAEPADIAEMPVRHFDGAASWRYLD
jgi:hypothetical protein